MKLRLLIPFLVAVALLGACSSGDSDPDDATTTTEPTESADTSAPEEDQGLVLTSAAFGEGEAIPARYGCDGDDISPQLLWSGVPEDAAELALVMDDPDAPEPPFVHWVAYGLAPSMLELIEEQEADGFVYGTNSAGSTGYLGPCPPPGDGEHRYVFTLYALDEEASLGPGASAEELRSAMEGHILEEATLSGLYER
ncbi:MAG: hypothetical protein JJLCMIEE_00237 [Acidimicrobiales bacterium]|nr:hypothetical protein [Acidimicrobiales bacterium]